MVTRMEALRALKRAGCSRAILNHSLAVERVALRLAKKIRENGWEVDLNLVSSGALLHDIGRAKTHGIRHGIEGAKILEEMGLGEFKRFAECHLGAGIPAREAKELGLPVRDFLPRSTEEKIVSYADKLVMGSRSSTPQKALEWLMSELGTKHPAIKRFEKLHEEIQKLMSR